MLASSRPFSSAKNGIVTMKRTIKVFKVCDDNGVGGLTV